MSNTLVSYDTLILASKSPRRRALLRQAGLSFTVVPSRIDETALPKDTPKAYVAEAARAKATDVSSLYPENWVISADTVIVHAEHIFGKPQDKKEARWMLSRLSDSVHTVLTGYYICCKVRAESFSGISETEVEFKQMTDGEIDWYIRTGEPFDKAGGYAIQGLGGTLVKRIAGSYTNVVGLPLCEIVSYLTDQEVVRR